MGSGGPCLFFGISFSFFFTLLDSECVCELRVTDGRFHHKHKDPLLLGFGNSVPGQDIAIGKRVPAPHTGSPAGSGCRFTKDSRLVTVRGPRTQ